MAESDMIRRAKEGDRAALSELLATYRDQAYRLALHIVRNPNDAEDATQNAFVRAFTHLDRFDESRPLSPWLLRIVVREALKLLRAEKVRFAFSQRQIQVREIEETVESAVMVRAEHKDLWRAVNRLGNKHRLVLTLSYLMEMAEAEVAQVLGIRRGTVKSRKHNALVRLRALVEREFPDLQPMVLGAPQ